MSFVKKTQEQYINDLCELYNVSKNDFKLLTPYRGWNEKIAIQCSYCGLIKESNAGNLVRSRRKGGSLCRCFRLKEESRELIRQYNNWKEIQTDFELLEDYKGVKINILVQCKKCGATQKRSINSLVKGDGCLICEEKHSQRKTTKQFEIEMEQLYGEEYSLLSSYLDSYSPVIIRHNKCGFEYQIIPHNFLTLKGGRCPRCHSPSRGEKDLENILTKNNIKFITQKRLAELPRCPYDFYLPDYNLLIEFQGIQHYQPIEYFGGEEALKKRKERDKTKEEVAISAGYYFLSIPYFLHKDMEQLLAQRLSQIESNQR